MRGERLSCHQNERVLPDPQLSPEMKFPENGDFGEFDCVFANLLERRFSGRPGLLPENDVSHPASSIRCSARNNDPGFAGNVSRVICSIRREIPSPCISPSPGLSGSADPGFPAADSSDSDSRPQCPIECLQEPLLSRPYRMSIGIVAQLVAAESVAIKTLPSALLIASCHTHYCRSWLDRGDSSVAGRRVEMWRGGLGLA